MSTGVDRRLSRRPSSPSPLLGGVASSSSSVGGYSEGLLGELGRQFESGLFCDVRLTVDGRSFSAHRNVLSAATPYFRAMFSSDLEEANVRTVTMHEVSAPVLEKLLRFIYSGVIHINCDDAQDILAAADMLELTAVVDLCCKFLISELHPSNCIGMYLFADALSCLELRNKADIFINSHFLDVVQSNEFKDIPVDILITFLQSESLFTDNEFQVFSAAMKWLFEDIDERRKYVYDVLAPVRLPLISQRHLVKYINECFDLRVKIVLQALLSDLCCDGRLKMRAVKPLHYQPRKYAQKTVYVIGGYSREEGGRWSDSQCLNTVETFNSFTQKWKLVTRTVAARSGHASTVLDNKVYVIGGECDSMIYDSMECYDMVTGRWSPMPSMNVPRSGLGVCTVNDRIYAFGGWVGAEIGRTIEYFDLSEKKWTIVDRNNSCSQRFAMGVIEFQGLVYLIGGISELGIELCTVDCYNPITNGWTSLSPMATKRAYAGVSFLDGCIYVVGGLSDSKDALSTVEKYSVEENCWSTVASMAVARAGAVAAAGNGRLYVFGGRDYSSEFRAPATMSSVECYDPETDSWTFVTSMAFSRCEASVAII